MANQGAGRYPPLDFSADPRRRTGVALLVAGLATLGLLMIAYYIVVANWWYAAEGTEDFDYWFDIAFVVAFSFGAGAALVGLVLIDAGSIKRRR